MRKIFVFCMLSLLVSGNLWAHEDKIITYKNGKLIGLPKQYLPAEFDLNQHRLRIKNHVINISQAPYLNSFFPEKDEKYEMVISSSWYHEKTYLPSYIVFHIKPSGKDFSYEILFNMDTLDVIKVTVVLKTSPDSQRDIHVMLDQRSMNDIANAIETVKESP